MIQLRLIFHARRILCDRRRRRSVPTSLCCRVQQSHTVQRSANQPVAHQPRPQNTAVWRTLLININISTGLLQTILTSGQTAIPIFIPIHWRAVSTCSVYGLGDNVPTPPLWLKLFTHQATLPTPLESVMRGGHSAHQETIRSTAVRT